MSAEQPNFYKRLAEELSGQEKRLEAHIKSHANDDEPGDEIVQEIHDRLKALRGQIGKLEHAAGEAWQEIEHEVKQELAGIEHSINEWSAAARRRKEGD